MIKRSHAYRTLCIDLDHERIEQQQEHPMIGVNVVRSDCFNRAMSGSRKPDGLDIIETRGNFFLMMQELQRRNEASL